MKKHLALVLALVMVLSSFSFVSAAPDFADVDGTVYEEAVDRLELLNILKGYPDGTFRPEGNITRAEFAAVAVRVSGLENVAMAAKGLPTGFTDVPAWHWASGYVGTAAKMGIVNGIGNGLFAPETPVKYEEAITMIVRALGYEPMAQARGGYPFGYLIVANEIDLLDGAMGTQGTWATRGFVAQITDNALEIPMMIQVGYGADTKWVVSGEDDTDEEYLIERMGFEPIEGLVTDVDVEDMEVYIDDEDDNGWFNVAEGFDFFMTRGAEVKAWVDGDDVIAYVINDDVSLDAFDYDDFDFARDAEVMFNGEEAEDVVAEFAKFVEDSDGDVSYVEAFTFDGFILVEEVEDEIIIDMNDEEVDVEDFVVLKDGKTVSVDALEEGDVVFYYSDDVLGGEYDGLAIAYNESEVGEIDRVYSNAEMSFRLDGSDYDYVFEAMYLDGSTLDTLDADILDMMMDEETEVEVFLNFEGDVVLVVGETGEGDTSTFYAVLIDDAVAYDGRSGDMLALDMLNEFGEEVSFDITDKFIADGDFVGVATSSAIMTDDLEADFTLDHVNAPFLFEVEVDEDGDLETLELLAVRELHADGFEIDDTYAKVGATDYRLMTSTVVFFDYDAGEFEDVVALGEIDGEFAEVEDGYAFVEEGRAKVVLATATDADTERTDYTGLVTDVTELRTGELVITIEVAGTEYEFTTAEDADQYVTVTEDRIYTLSVGDTSGEIDLITLEVLAGDTFDSVQSTREFTLTSGGAVSLTSDAVIYEFGTDDTMSLRDIEDDAVVHVLFDGSSDYWVIYMLVEVDEVADAPAAGNVEAIGTGYIVVDGQVVIDTDTTIVRDPDGVIVEVGADAFNGNIAVGDTVEIDGDTVTITAYAD